MDQFCAGIGINGRGESNAIDMTVLTMIFPASDFDSLRPSVLAA